MLYGEGFWHTMMHGIMENCNLWLRSSLTAAPMLKAILLLFFGVGSPVLATILHPMEVPVGQWWGWAWGLSGRTSRLGQAAAEG